MGKVGIIQHQCERLFASLKFKGIITRISANKNGYSFVRAKSVFILNKIDFVWEIVHL